MIGHAPLGSGASVFFEPGRSARTRKIREARNTPMILIHWKERSMINPQQIEYDNITRNEQRTVRFIYTTSLGQYTTSLGQYSVGYAA